MKYSAIILICVLLPHSIAAQEIDVSVNYTFSMFNFSEKFYSGSVLTWRDNYLHGVAIDATLNTSALGFDTLRIHTGFAGSADGYHVDDDANNQSERIHVMSSDAALLELAGELAGGGEIINPRLGLEFAWLGLKQYDYRRFSTNADGGFRDGKINEYNVLKLGAYYGAQIMIARNGAFYLSLSGHAGAGLHLDFANWIYRTDFKNPFFVFGVLFKGEGGIECGFMFRGFTLFGAFQAGYEISPWLTGAYANLANGSASMQSAFTEFSRAVISAGIRARF